MSQQTSPPPHRKAVLAVWAVAATFVLLLLLAVTSLLHVGGQEAQLRLESRASQLVAQTEAELNRTLVGADLVLGGLPTMLAGAFPAGQAADVERAHNLLMALNERQLIFDDITLLDENGQTLAGGLPASHRNGLQLPDGLLAKLAAQTVPQLLVAGPFVGPISGERALLLLRPLQLANGSRVMAVGEVPVALLAPSFSDNRADPDAIVTLEGDDGRLLASMPPNDALGGQRLSPALSLDLADGIPRVAPARIGGHTAVQAVRPLLYRDLRLSVSLPVAEGLAAWHKDGRAILLTAAVFLLLFVAAAGLAHWQILRLARARAAMAQSADTLDKALAAMADGFLLCDSQDRVLRWNDRYLSLFPWLQGVLAPGVPFRRLAEVGTLHAAAGNDAAARAEWIEMRVRMHREGNHAWEQAMGNGMFVRATERRMLDGGVVSIYRDVSAEERRLAQAKAAAEAANEAKSQFLANISHELRTPLNAVIGLNELLLVSPLNAQQREHARLVRTSGQLLLALINDILDVARIEAGRLDLRSECFDPRLAATEVLALLREQATAKGLALSLSLAEDISARLMGDAVRVRQVLFNLLGNAVKFTDQGTVSVHLAQQTGHDGLPELLLTVQDTGIGIAPAAMPTLFQRFSQADNTTARRYGGTGLGLAITQEIVRAMGGEIQVASQPGVGSTFTVRLPCRPAPEPAPEKPALQTPAEQPQPSRSLRVMAVEDNPVNQILIEALLVNEGHRVDVVPNGAQAVDSARQAVHDLILMDMQMPVLDGLEAARAIRGMPPPACNVPIVAMTANARAEDRQACMEAGMDDYVSKPIDGTALKEAMNSALARAERRRNKPA